MCCGEFVCAVMDLCVMWRICVCCGGFVCDVTLMGHRISYWGRPLCCCVASF